MRIGYLLGTRDFQAQRDWFHDGDRLVVTATVFLSEGGMGVFDCRVELNNELVASARLNVFQPGDGATAGPGDNNAYG